MVATPISATSRYIPPGTTRYYWVAAIANNYVLANMVNLVEHDKRPHHIRAGTVRRSARRLTQSLVRDD